jgi:DNA-binding CsgD family transcriptional regulator
MLRPHDIDDELRGVLRVDGEPWAAVGLFRERGRPPFDASDRALIASLSQPLAEAVRNHARAAVLPAPDADRATGPGLMLFRPDGELISANDEALAWLDELPAEPEPRAGLATRLPMVVSSTLMRARAIAQERDHRTARARMRSPATGRWLVCHASCLREADGTLGDIALVIEPAPASEVAPIVVAAYGLTAREQEITQLIARGHDTAQISGGLHLSAHTVRDYVKAIFEKVGVRSRGELVATLYAQHYAPRHHDPAGVDQVDG